MKILKSEYMSWGNDPDLGEKLIGHGLIKNKHLLFEDYSYVFIALSPLINNQGIFKTQQIIDDICKENNNTKLIFVCQHIFVDKINWYNSIVFSTHAIKSNKNIISIPHYSATYNKALIKEERDILFSFVGHSGTHPIREYFVKKYPDKCFSTEGEWMSKKYKNKYIELLGKSKFSLCIRGTGPSSLRIYESLYMGSVPIIISDDLVLPLSNIFNWDRVSVRINENEIDNLEDILFTYSDEEVKEMSKLGQNFWEEYCSDVNLYKTIIEILKNK